MTRFSTRIFGLRLFAAVTAIGGAQANAQVFTEFSVPTAFSNPEGITAGPDGNLWFTESNVSTIGRITTAGVITEFRLPTKQNSRPSGIVAGPDGSLWFTEYNVNKIGRITTAGVITEFPIPTLNGVWGIASGPDGSLWFTEYGKIGRITTSGVITQFSYLGGNPHTITSGPDGNLWFTMNNGSGSRVGKITTAGVVTEFPLQWSAWGITSGPDGNLWVAEDGRVGRITTSGVITEFVNPNFHTPYYITAGPDGNLWFTEGNVNKIGRITTSGVTTEFDTPGAGTPYLRGIAGGPDENIWFVEQGNGGKVVRFVCGPKNIGNTLRLSKLTPNVLAQWSDVFRAKSYALYQSQTPNGEFAAIAGTGTSGEAGIIVPMTADDLLCFRIAGVNSCGNGPK